MDAAHSLTLGSPPSAFWPDLVNAHRDCALLTNGIDYEVVLLSTMVTPVGRVALFLIVVVPPSLVQF